MKMEMGKPALLVALFLILTLPLHAQASTPGIPAPAAPAESIEAPDKPVGGTTTPLIGDTVDASLMQFAGEMDKLGMCGVADEDLSTWIFTPMFIALIVVIFAITIMYMLSTLFTAPALEAFSRQEAYEVMLTVAIAITFFSVAGLVDSVVLGTSGEAGLFDRGMEYSKVIALKLTGDIVYVGVMNTGLYMYSSTTFRFGGPLHQAVRFNIGPILKPLVDLFGVAANLLALSLGTWLANINLLCFIKRVAMPIFLPLGLFMRAVPQLRGGGNALIAFAFAFFIIYPLMLSINFDIYNFKYGAYTHESFTVDHDDDPSTPGITRYYSSPLRNMLNNFMLDSGLIGMGIMLAGVVLLGGGALGTLWFFFITFGSIAMIYDLVFTVFILSIFLPLLNIFVTLTFAREIAKFLGTEINITAFTKLI